MTTIKTITQAKYDKELRSFIDRLSKIKIDYKLNDFEQKMIDESGKTALLYTICMMKVVMKENDTNVRKKMGIRINFYKYLKALLEDEFLILTKAAFNYLNSLIEIEKISEEEADNYFMNFFVQGHDYIREHYYPEDSPFKDPEFIDKIIDLEETLEQIQEEGFETGTLKLEFDKAHQRVTEIVLELNDKQEILKQKMLNPSTIQREDLAELLIFSTTMMEEYELLINLMNCAIVKQKETKELCDELIFFITDEGLLDKFNQVNKLDIRLAVKEYVTRRQPKRKRKKTNNPDKKN